MTQGNLGHALHRFSGHVFEVGGAAANHRAKGDDGVVFAAGRHLVQHHGHLEGAGQAHDGDVILVRAMTLEGVDGACFQVAHHKAVPARHHQAVAATAGDEVSFNGLDAHISYSCSSGSSKSTNSVTSRWKPARACRCLGALMTRIFFTPRSMRICAPTPKVRSSLSLILP